MRLVSAFPYGGYAYLSAAARPDVVSPTPVSVRLRSRACYPSCMSSAGVKQRIIDTVQQLPDDATVEDAIERLYFLAEIERGLVQSETGQGVAHEEIKKRFAK